VGEYLQAFGMFTQWFPKLLDDLTKFRIVIPRNSFRAKLADAIFQSA
jgi:hypothetical protein